MQEKLSIFDDGSGTTVYEGSQAITRLAELGIELDWLHNALEAGEQSARINADQKIAIVVSSGNRHVGNPDVDPSASRPRGAMTAYYYRSRDEQKVYAELSLLTEPGEDVTFGKFRERIIIPPISFGYAQTPLDAGLEDVDVSFIIKRRGA